MLHITMSKTILSCQELLKEAVATPNVVKATNRPKLYEELEEIQGR